jgi:hypothetical protein
MLRSASVVPEIGRVTQGEQVSLLLSYGEGVKSYRRERRYLVRCRDKQHAASPRPIEFVMSASCCAAARQRTFFARGERTIHSQKTGMFTSCVEISNRRPVLASRSSRTIRSDSDAYRPGHDYRTNPEDYAGAVPWSGIGHRYPLRRRCGVPVVRHGRGAGRTGDGGEHVHGLGRPRRSGQHLAGERGDGPRCPRSE